jgi:hypothetical protein
MSLGILAGLFLLFSCENALVEKLEQDILLSKAPRILSVVPAADFVDVSISSSVKIYFNEEMDAASVEDEENIKIFYINTEPEPDELCYINGTLEYSSFTKAVSFYPAELLNINTRYTVLVKKEIRSLKGLALAEDYLWDFTTNNQIPPTGSLIIDNGADFSTSAERTVILNLTRSSSNVSRIQLSLNPEFTNSYWADYPANDEYSFTLADSDAEQSVYIKLKDEISNLISQIYFDSIILDRGVPAVDSVAINSNASYSKSRTVTAVFSLSGDYAEMEYYATGAASSGWISPELSHSFTFESDGLKTVYVRVKDLAGNVSQYSSSSITVDTVPPGQPVINENYANTLGRTGSWSWSSGGAGNGVFAWYMDGVELGTGTAASYSYSTMIAATGDHSFKVREYDDAGNYAEATDTFKVVNSLPVLSDPAVVCTTPITWRPQAGYTWFQIVFDWLDENDDPVYSHAHTVTGTSFDPHEHASANSMVSYTIKKGTSSAGPWSGFAGGMYDTLP